MNNKIYAVINSKTNIVENVIVWDGRTEVLEVKKPEIVLDEEGNEIPTGNMVVVEKLLPWLPPKNTYVVCIEGIEAGIGWLYNDGEFTDVREVSNQSE